MAHNHLLHICAYQCWLWLSFIMCMITYRSDNSQYAVCVPHADSTRVAVLSTLAPSAGACGVCPSGLAPHALFCVHDDHRGRGGHLPPRQPLCAIQTGQSRLQRDNGNRGKTLTHTDALASLTHTSPQFFFSKSVVSVGDWVVQTDGSRSVPLAWLCCACIV